MAAFAANATRILVLLAWLFALSLNVVPHFTLLGLGKVDSFHCQYDCGLLRFSGSDFDTRSDLGSAAGRFSTSSYSVNTGK